MKVLNLLGNDDMTKAAPLVLVIALLGCGRAAPPEAAASRASDASDASEERPGQVDKSHAAGVAAVQVLGPAEAAASGLALDGAGLRLFNTVSGASRLIPFGARKSDVLRAVGAAQKIPISSQGSNPDCKATHVSWDTGLTLWFAEDRLVGWSSAVSAAPPATAAGIRVGSSRKELANVYTATFKRSTRGEVFSTGSIAGLLDSDQPGAVITQLWAGQACVAN